MRFAVGINPRRFGVVTRNNAGPLLHPASGIKEKTFGGRTFNVDAQKTESNGMLLRRIGAHAFRGIIKTNCGGRIGNAAEHAHATARLKRSIEAKWTDAIAVAG